MNILKTQEIGILPMKKYISMNLVMKKMKKTLGPESGAMTQFPKG